MLTFHIKELLQMLNEKAKVFPETGHLEFTECTKRKNPTKAHYVELPMGISCTC